MTDDDEIREIYAHFGLAVYLAQVLEHSIANAMVYADLIPSKARTVKSKAEWADQFDQFMSSQFEKTLGKLLRDLGLVMELCDLRSKYQAWSWLLLPNVAG